MRGLPLPWMTRPDEAPLNLATQLPSNANPTDLGPKGYIAFGTPEVRPGRAWRLGCAAVLASLHSEAEAHGRAAPLQPPGLAS